MAEAASANRGAGDPAGRVAIVTGGSRALARVWAGYGIPVHVVAPGSIATEMNAPVRARAEALLGATAAVGALGADVGGGLAEGDRIVGGLDAPGRG